MGEVTDPGERMLYCTVWREDDQRADQEDMQWIWRTDWGWWKDRWLTGYTQIHSVGHLDARQILTQPVNNTVYATNSKHPFCKSDMRVFRD